MTPQTLTNTLIEPWVHGEHVEAVGEEFDAPVRLNGLTLRSFDLSGSGFEQGLSAQSAVLRGMAWFHNARIGGTLDLTGARCCSDLRLDGLVCDRLILTDAQFEGVLTLDRARIGTIEAARILCLANLSMAGTVVKDTADFSGATVMGGIWAEGTSFGRLELTGAELDGRQRGV